MINKTQEKILKALYRRDYYIAELARTLSMDYSTIWERTIELKTKGLVQFSKDFNRKEGKVATLTDKGKAYTQILIKMFQ